VAKQLPDERLERLRRSQFIVGPGERPFGQNFFDSFLWRCGQLGDEQCGLSELVFLESRDDFRDNICVSYYDGVEIAAQRRFDCLDEFWLNFQLPDERTGNRFTESFGSVFIL
jgi:hypothetical protein